MADQTWDILFLGGGAGAEGAIRARRLGLRAAVVERERLGGTMIHWGGASVRSFLRSARFFKQAASSEDFAVRLARPVLGYEELLARNARIARSLEESLGDRLRESGAALILGEGSLREPGVVRVIRDGREEIHKASRVVLATGSRPKRPTELTPDGVHILTTDDALQLREVPQSVCIIGAGPAGCEFASLYTALGSQVMLLERESSLLPRLDFDLGRELAARFASQGVAVYTSVSKVTAGRVAEGVQVEYVVAGQQQSAKVEKVLLATGRSPNSHRMGLDRVGVALDENGFVSVDSSLEASVPGVFAVGDLIGEPMLAHRAVYEAQLAAELAAGAKQARIVTFGIAVDGLWETASVGQSEGQAREAFGSEVSVVRARITEDSPMGYLKLVFDPEGKLAGAHLMGTNASGLLAFLSVAVRQGLGVQELRAALPDFAGFPFDRLLLQGE